VDATKVGGFGASLGGESLLLMAGAQLTTTVGQSYKQVTFDPRLKAAATYVPYFGQVVFSGIWPRPERTSRHHSAACSRSAVRLTRPPPSPQPNRDSPFLTNTRQLVALTDVEHGFNPAFSDEIFTWSLAFLAGQLSGDPVARATSARMTSVAGGGDDVLKTDYIAPSPAASRRAHRRRISQRRAQPLFHHRRA
jgi:hypothetical protein